MFHPSLPIGRSLAVEQPFSNKLMEIPQITYDLGVGRLILHRLWRADLIYDAQWGFIMDRLMCCYNTSVFCSSNQDNGNQFDRGKDSS